MATIGDIKAGLNHGKNEAERALEQLSGVAGQLDRAIAVLQALTAGTSQPSVMSAIGKLNAATQKFAEGATAIRYAIDEADRYNAVMRHQTGPEWPLCH